MLTRQSACLLAVSLLLAACHHQALAQNPGSLAGRVVGADGQPMANVPVSVVPVGRDVARRPGTPGGAAQTTTDDEGGFKINALPPGSYSVSSSAPGYVTLPPPGEGGLGVYRPGDFALVTLVKGGVISGKVTDAVGEPLTGVNVNVIRVGNLEGEADTSPVASGFGRNWRTDDLGAYRIYGLAPGSYVIQAGARGFGPNFPSPFSEDAPTYYPSAVRDAAVAVAVNAGEEIGGIDIRYRGERGRTVSGRATAKAGGAGGGFGATEISLTDAASGALVATTLQMERGANRGFALYGVPDGEYEISARRGGFGGADEDAVAPPRRVSVRGADVAGIELALAPLAAISGRVVIERQAAAKPVAPAASASPAAATPEAAVAPAVCQNQRASFVEEVLLRAQRDDAPTRETELAERFSFARPAAPNAGGEFTLRGLAAGRHRLTAQLPDENWYVRAINLDGKPSDGAARKTPPARATGAPTNAARDGILLKPGERLSGLTVIIAEGAAGVKGRAVTADGRAPRAQVIVHLIPAEKEAADDLLRYSQTNVGDGGVFNFKRLAPGRYYLLAKAAQKGERGESSARPEAWDTARRAALRSAAEAGGQAVELQACQRLADYQVTLTAP
jgi:hypothetical protein